MVGVTAGDCTARFAIPVLCESSAGLPAAIAIAALPLILFGVAHRPLAALLALYIVLVPIDDVLLVGPAVSITKLIGLVAAAVAIATIVRRGAEIRVSYAVFGWAALVGLMALSVIWGVDPTSSTETLSTIVSVFVLFVILAAVPIEPLEFRTVIAATIASGALAGIISMVMAQHQISTIAGQAGRLYLSFGNAVEDPNRFGAALILPIAMSVGAFVAARGWARIALLVPLALTFTAWYLTASRGTTLALIAMAIVAILASRYRLALSGLLALCIGLLLIIPNEITSRFFAEGTATSGAGRLDIWRVAVEIFHRHWLLGTGVGTFETAYNRAFLLAYEPLFAGWNRDPHSLLISTSTELGIVGLICLVVALVLQYRSVRFIGPDHPFPWLRTTLRASLVGLLVAALFVDVLATKFSWLLFTEMLLAARLVTHPLMRKE